MQCHKRKYVFSANGTIIIIQTCSQCIHVCIYVYIYKRVCNIVGGPLKIRNSLNDLVRNIDRPRAQDAFIQLRKLLSIFYFFYLGKITHVNFQLTNYLQAHPPQPIGLLYVISLTSFTATTSSSSSSFCSEYFHQLNRRFKLLFSIF